MKIKHINVLLFIISVMLFCMVLYGFYIRNILLATMSVGTFLYFFLLSTIFYIVLGGSDVKDKHYFEFRRGF